VTVNDMQLLIDLAVDQSEAERQKSRPWTDYEDVFLKEQLGYLTDAEIGKKLGRTEIAVHLRWSRDLNLPSPSKDPGVVNAHEAARILNVDPHKTANWVDHGFIRGRLMAGGRKIRLIDRKDFEEWALNTDHWMYFNIHEVADPELKEKLLAKSKEWGDEWWPTTKVAEYHNVATGDVKRQIQDGRLKATQTRVSFGGRHKYKEMKWKLWFVLKSDAVKAVFVKRGPRKKVK